MLLSQNPLGLKKQYHRVLLILPVGSVNVLDLFPSFIPEHVLYLGQDQVGLYQNCNA